MKSCIYRGTIRHRRYIGKPHTFKYRLFFLCLDLERINETFKPYWFWSGDKSNIAAFKRQYYLGDKSKPLVESVRDRFSEKGLPTPDKIYLLTNLSYFGYCFNPISLYFCVKNNEVTHCLVEITNTPWLEQNVQLVTMKKIREHAYRAKFKKKMHVSPFLSMDYIYHMRCHISGDHLGVHIENHQDDQIHFDATLSLTAYDINSLNLAKVLLIYPLITFKIFVAIRWQALKLWLKRNPVFEHP